MKLVNRVSNRLAVYFYYTAKPRPINPISWSRRLWDSWGKFQLESKAPDLLRLVEQMAVKCSSTGCGYGDYWSLYKTVIDRKPRRVVECGSGMSTVVIAYAMRKNGGGGGGFVSLEQAQVYYDNIVGIFPSELRGYVDFILSETVEVQIGDVLGFRYQYQAPEPVDFMYIDGPSLRTHFDRKELPKAINSDVFFVPKSETFAAILDQRIATMWTLKARLGSHDVRYNVMKRQTFIEKNPTIT